AVEEFALGFGPLLLSFQWGETQYSWRLLPLGGFVRMAGMFPEDEIPPDEKLAAPGAKAKPYEEGRGFNDQTVGRRAAIIAAGPIMNIFLAIVLFVIVYGGLGVPQPTLTVDRLVPGLPAETAGILPGDRLVAIDGRRLTSWDQVPPAVAQSHGAMDVVVERQGVEKTFVLTPVVEDGRKLMGIAPKVEPVRLPFLAAVGAGFQDTGAMVGGLFQGLAQLAQPGGTQGVMGPVGIAGTIAEASRAGLAQVLFLAGIISLNLGLINLLPIPALDGSRLVFLAWEAMRGKPMDPRKEGLIHLVGFALLMLLILMVTVQDIHRLTGS
ncbi:MAG: M50 family metallopeptidase, partial [Bacillota bacterium]|nr:M50 family metallopeptidase [Bacillota bacterium]